MKSVLTLVLALVLISESALGAEIEGKESCTFNKSELEDVLMFLRVDFKNLKGPTSGEGSKTFYLIDCEKPSCKLTRISNSLPMNVHSVTSWEIGKNLKMKSYGKDEILLSIGTNEFRITKAGLHISSDTSTEHSVGIGVCPKP